MCVIFHFFFLEFNYIFCYGQASNDILKPLHSLYRRSLKYILNKPTSLYQNDYQILDILPFHSKLKFNKAVFMFKIMTGKSPISLKLLFPTKNIYCKNIILIKKPTNNIFKNSFTYSGASLWNSLPQNIRSSSSFYTFKNSYHRYLFASNN